MRRLVRCPEPATRFAKVDGAISMRRFDRIPSDDAFVSGCVVTGIDTIFAGCFRRQIGVAGFVGFRLVGSSPSTDFTAILMVDFPTPFPFADTGGSAWSGCQYAAGELGDVYFVRSTPEVVGPVSVDRFDSFAVSGELLGQVLICRITVFRPFEIFRPNFHRITVQSFGDYSPFA